MKSIPKLIRRFVGLLLLSFLLLAAVNVLIFGAVAFHQMENARPWATAETVAAALQKTEDGYALSQEGAEALHSTGAWAILIDNETKSVVWHSPGLPETIPREYTLSGIASLTRGYLDGYPTFPCGAASGLVVLGFPKTSFWKHMWPSWDYQLIAHAPEIALAVIVANLAVILLIYGVASTKLLRSIKPITNGIQALPSGEPVALPETGLLSEIAFHINAASQMLQTQKRQLQRRDTARANWIAGVSHDIRTPLSMVMGYADQLQADPNLSPGQRHQAAAILRQGQRIRDLISDLNLASKLEYHMQSIPRKPENAVAIVRQVVVDFLNSQREGTYPVEWRTEARLSACWVNADRELLKRAVSNLIQNSVHHNEQGCTIYVSVAEEKGSCLLCVEDDGVGATDEQLQRLNSAPHSTAWEENPDGPRQGLGLRIVKQIADAHGGQVAIRRSRYGGFSVTITLPMLSANRIKNPE